MILQGRARPAVVTGHMTCPEDWSDDIYEVAIFGDLILYTSFKIVEVQPPNIGRPEKVSFSCLVFVGKKRTPNVNDTRRCGGTG